MARIVIPNSKLGNRDGDRRRTDNSNTIVSESEIALLAYNLWQSRGCPEGSPEADWYQAVEEHRQATSSFGASVRSASA